MLGQQVSIQAGTLSGTGTIKGDLVNGGSVDLGSMPGTLTVSGNYTQTAAAAHRHQGRRNQSGQPV